MTHALAFAAGLLLGPVLLGAIAQALDWWHRRRS